LYILLVEGKETKEIPFQISKVKIDPVYKAFKGWSKPLRIVKPGPIS